MFTSTDIDDAFTFGISSRLGLMFNSKYFSAGLVYQDKQYMADYLGKATVDATNEVNRLTGGNPSQLQLIDASINPGLGFAGVYDLRIQDFEGPRMFGAGIAIRPHRRLSFGVDYTFIKWSEVAHNFRTRLSGGDNQNLSTMIGPTIHVKIPLDFDDQHVIALGLTALAYEGDDLVEGVPSWALVLRAGYNFGKNPTPGDTTLPQQPTIAEHHVTGGATIHIGPLVEVNLGFEWALPSKLDTPAGPVPNVSRADFSLSRSTQRVELMFFHFGLGFNF
jgi:long-subunit fatty acid transport protein